MCRSKFQSFRAIERLPAVIPPVPYRGYCSSSLAFHSVSLSSITNMKNIFKRNKKPTSANPDINKSLLQGDAGLGMYASRPSSPTSPSSPAAAAAVTTQASTELDTLKRSEPKTPKKETKEGYEWDFCLVLPNPEHEDFKAEPVADNYIPPSEILRRLHDAGLQTYQYYSGDWDEIFIKIRAPLDILRAHAQNVEYKILLDSNYIKRHIENLKEPIGGDINHTKLSPYEFIYANYNDGKLFVTCCAGQ